MSYYITVGNKVIYRGIKTEGEASSKCCMIMALTSRLDVFYHKETKRNKLKKVI